jgi:phage terminase large subunit-like protein
VWTQDEGSFLDAALVDAMFTLDGPKVEGEEGRRYDAGLDLGHSSDSTAFAIVHREGEEVHLDRLVTWTPTKGRPVDFGEVEEFVLAARKRFKFKLRFDPWQGISMAERFKEKRIPTEPFQFGQASKQKLAAALLEAVNTGTLKLYEDEHLRKELLELRLRQAPSGAWSWDHPAGGHDDRVVALSLALMGALERRRRPTPDVSPVSITGPSAWRGSGGVQVGVGPWR